MREHLLPHLCMLAWRHEFHFSEEQITDPGRACNLSRTLHSASASSTGAITTPLSPFQVAIGFVTVISVPTCSMVATSFESLTHLPLKSRSTSCRFHVEPPRSNRKQENGVRAKTTHRLLNSKYICVWTWDTQTSVRTTLNWFASGLNTFK